MQKLINLVNGNISRRGKPFEVQSPINQKASGVGYLMSKDDLFDVFENSSLIKPIFDLSEFGPLGDFITKNRIKFIDQITLDTGYTLKDSGDIVDGSIEFVTFFDKYIKDTLGDLLESRFSYLNKIPRHLKLVSKPFGIIAAMTPQNAPLILELTVILNALAAGNKVVLRPSSQCTGTVSLLIEALAESLPERIIKNISIISCKATDFLEASYRFSNLIHYIGSSSHGKRILNDSLLNNIKSLVDGEGNSTVIIDNVTNVETAVKACRDGIIRCNGELCSTVRTIVVDIRIFDEFVEKLKKSLDTVKTGDPFNKETDLGPLFNPEQKIDLYKSAEKYSIISGDETPTNLGNNCMRPLLIKLKSNDTGFLQEQVYGPLAGIAPFKNDGWKKWLTQTPYRVNDAVFSNNKQFIDEFVSTSNAPRIVINNDPSIESVFEPWGGFLPSGSNDVSFWINKYRKVVQLDTN